MATMATVSGPAVPRHVSSAWRRERIFFTTLPVLMFTAVFIGFARTYYEAHDQCMSVNIRRAAVGDEVLLASLNRFVQQLHLEHRPDHFRTTQSTELAAWYRSRLEQPSTRAWIAEKDGLPASWSFNEGAHELFTSPELLIAPECGSPARHWRR